MSELDEQYKIIQRFTGLYAGEGDEAQARQAVAAIMPVCRKGKCKGSIHAR